MARPTSVAATAESTPPESAHSACLSPTCSRTFSTVCSMKDPGNQLGLMPATWVTKRSRISRPCVGVVNFRVKFQRILSRLMVLDDGNGVLGPAGNRKARRNLHHVVAVAVPDLEG